MSHPSPAHVVPSRPAPRRRLPLLLLSVALMACGRQATSPSASTSGPVQLEAEAGTISPLAPQDIAEPRTGGKIIRDQGASGGQAVILLGNNDAVRFKLPANFTPGRYTVKVQARGVAYQGWPVVALENDRRQRMSTTTLGTPTYALRGFGQFDLRPNQEMSVSLINDRYDGPGKDRNAVVDYLVIEPMRTTPARPYTVQFGTSFEDYAQSVGVDAGDNAYVAGSVIQLTPAGTTPLDVNHLFIRKTNAQGQEVWTREIKTGEADYMRDIAVDAAGHSYVGGATWGTLPGQSNRGRYDAFVRKYGTDGAEAWTRQFGTAGGDIVNGVSIDAGGNVYVVGITGENLPGPTEFGGKDSFIRKYTSDGTEVWTRQFGTAGDDSANDVSVDGVGNVYVVGDTEGAFLGLTSAGGRDVFVAKFNASGTPVWVRQFGTVGTDPDLDESQSNLPLDYDFANSVRVDRGGNIYVAGTVRGVLPGQKGAGLADAFVRKYSPNGAELWTRQSGTVNRDTGTLGMDDAGNVYLARNSYTPGIQERSVSVLLKYTPDGALIRSWPVNAVPVAVNKVTVGASGNIFLAGSTGGAFPGFTNRRGSDAFLIKLVP